MMTAVNAQERTIGHVIELLDGTGWKLGSIGRSPEGALALCVCDAVAV